MAGTRLAGAGTGKKSRTGPSSDWPEPDWPEPDWPEPDWPEQDFASSKDLPEQDRRGSRTGTSSREPRSARPAARGLLAPPGVKECSRAPPATPPTPMRSGAARARAASVAILGGPGVLAVKGLQKSYRGRMVVNDAGLMVPHGEAVGLLGPNAPARPRSST